MQMASLARLPVWKIENHPLLRTRTLAARAAAYRWQLPVFISLQIVEQLRFIRFLPQLA